MSINLELKLEVFLHASIRVEFRDSDSELEEFSIQIQITISTLVYDRITDAYKF